MKKKLLILALLLIPSFSFAASIFSPDGAGTTVANFLKFGAGARAIGMGNANTAVLANSADSIYWNPAAISVLKKMDATLMYSSYWMDMSYSWVAFAMPTQAGTFGIAVQYFNWGSIDETDGAGGFTGAKFSGYDLAVYLSYANKYMFDDDSVIRYGANFKIISSKLISTAFGAAVDAGTIYTLKDQLTSFGFSFHNLGTPMRYDVESEPLPFDFKIGASRIFFDNLLVAADLVFPSDNSIFPAFGAQYGLDVMQDGKIFFRAGYDMRSDAPGFTGFNAGFGAKFKDFEFDYAFSPYGDLGTAHRVSIGIKFGEELVEPVRSAAAPAKKPQTTPLVRTTALTSEQQGIEQTPQPQQPVQMQQTQQPSAVAAASQPDAVQNGQQQQKKKVVVLPFISSDIPASELTVYAQMFIKAFSQDNTKYTIIDKTSASDIENVLNNNAGLISAFAKTGADIVIVCKVIKDKANGMLNFEFSFYSKDLSVKTRTITSKDSFRDAQTKLGEFAAALAK